MIKCQRKKMLEYNHKEIEKKWQETWEKEKTYLVKNQYNLPKYYVLDMFPYPSGEGLHVGHPLGYIASDIVSRYKRHLGYNVLHPMGYDSFGLPAEQYAIQTGKHPAETTELNIKRYRQQLDRLGFSYDWSREIKTSDPNFYKWTQEFFILMFNSWYDKNEKKARKIEELVACFEKNGTKNIKASSTKKIEFSAKEWSNYNEQKKESLLMNYRIAFLSEGVVNWCPELGTVLANDEVKDGFSERGAHPVEQKKMVQWSLRISAYAERLLKGLEKVDFSNSLKEQQKNWIGKSKGSTVLFETENGQPIEVFTTRLDTIYGVGFMVLAPENKLVKEITTTKQSKEIEDYIKQTSKKSERQRISEKGKPTGAFTGAYAIHPLNKKKIPIWIADYVLNDYGTGAVMAVPSGDQRDHDFAKEFKIDIPEIFENINCQEKAYVEKDAKLKNSDFLNGMSYENAIEKITKFMDSKGFSKTQINYKLRDAIFSRQRYWGEPFPVYYEKNTPKIIENEQVLLPKINKFLPTENGDPPLGRAKSDDWNIFKGDRMEQNTMPGWAGSSWYFLRFMDPKNTHAFCSVENLKYWNQVDLYVGGAEHAVGHLLYSRFWTKFLYDHGKVPFDEPYKKLVNQGMIGGPIHFLWLKKEKENNFPVFVENYQAQDHTNLIKIPCHIDFVSSAGTKEAHLNIDQIVSFTNWRPEYKSALFEIKGKKLNLEQIKVSLDTKFSLLLEQGKMSKRYFNTIDPEKICDQYGADTLRCYEMFLGPLEEHKPWNTNGISGVNNFLKKTWNLVKGFNSVKPTEKELKILHKTIKKITEDIENLSLNTAISTFMIAVNELTKIKATSQEILSQLIILMSPFAPHISEELWLTLGNNESITQQNWPKHNEEYIKESEHEYPISFNGKMRFKIKMPLNLDKETIEKRVLINERTTKQIGGRSVKKVIVVPGKIVNIVI